VSLFLPFFYWWRQLLSLNAKNIYWVISTGNGVPFCHGLGCKVELKYNLLHYSQLFSMFELISPNNIFIIKEILPAVE
jgi:hypothetical protein